MSLAQTSVHSDLWHRVAELRFRLRAETVIDRQVVRGQVWFVAGDRFSARSYRMTPAVWSVLMRMDGRRTLDRIWRDVSEQLGEDAPAQDQILGVVSQLYTAELISSNRPVDSDEIAERAETQAKRLAAQRYRNPVFLRWPLFDPDRFLEATVHLVRPLCTSVGAMLWLALVGWFVVEAALHWEALTRDVVARVLATGSIVVFLAVFPPLKILHELGHAYAVKVFGGAVHEIGISFLTFMPAPYVDASAAVFFSNRWRRVGVAAAGMIVELAVAAVALVVWLHAEAGLVRSIAYDIVFIASISTIVFNANPLLRFDGYYILSDALDLPNLMMRSQRLYLAFIQRKLFGLRNVTLPDLAPREAFWLLVYAPASIVYRFFVLSGIALFVGTQYFFFGIGLVVWMIASAILWPIVKALRYVVLSRAVAGKRLRAMTLTFGTAALIIGLIAGLPLPYGTVVEGVVWIPEDAHVVTEGAGQVARYVAAPGTRVAAGAPLVELQDPYIASKRAGALARLAELEARYTAAEPKSPFETQLIQNQIVFAKNDLAETMRKELALIVRSPIEGTFLAPRGPDLIGAYMKQGERVGYVMSGQAPVVRGAVTEDEIDLVRSQVVGVAVRLEGAFMQPVRTARIAREFPSATKQLPSPALATTNGGTFTLDPADKDGKTTLLPFFSVDVEVPPDLVRERWGQRAWLRFDHGSSPLALRWWRAARQVFLGRFHV